MCSVRARGNGWSVSRDVLMLLVLCLCARAVYAQPVEAGYRDFVYGTGVSDPTVTMDQSKLWFNDGVWWGVLYSPVATGYEIFKLDSTTQTWASTGVAVDSRAGVHMDALSTGQKLYIVSGGDTLDALLTRYTYDAVAKAYTADAGFPVTVRTGGAPCISIARDSTGQLWAAWQSNRLVMLNCSTGSDTSWGQPFALPTQATGVLLEDICAIVAFNGDRIGVMWSDQIGHRFLFSAHLDSAADTTWQASETALADPVGDTTRHWADNHINLKAVGTGANGKLLAVVKTSLNDAPIQSQDDPLIMVLARDSAGGWTNSTVSTVKDLETRPILQIDEEHEIVHVLMPSPETGGAIYRKSCPLNDLRFTPGRGTPVIDSSADGDVYSPTSTKQNLTGATGMVVLASSAKGQCYLHSATALTNQFFNTLTPVADAYVRDGTNADTNFGGTSTLQTRTTTSAGNQRNSYLRFELNGVTGTPLSALLRVRAYTGSGGAVAVSAYAVADIAWGETTITWNNAPPMTGTVPLPSVTVSTTVPSFYDLDVSSYVLAQLGSGAGLMSLGLHNALQTSTNIVADSREQVPATVRPRLEILSQVGPVVPYPPTNLVATLQTGPQIALTWVDNSANEDSFALERSADGGSFAPLVTLAPNTVAYLDTTVAPGHSYAYRVQAVNAAGGSAWAASSTVSILGPPAAPTNLVASVRTVGKRLAVQLNWTDNANNETGFAIERSPDGVAWASRATVAANITSYRDDNVTQGSTYTYRVRAVNSAGPSDWAVSSAVTVVLPPAAPSNVVATVVAGPQVQIKWTDNANNETGFAIQRSDNGAAYADVAAPAQNATSWTDTSTQSGHDYRYQVRAVNAGGASAWAVSNTVTAGPPAKPTNLTATAALKKGVVTVTLRWTDNANNETGFVLEESTDPAFPAGVTTTSYLVGANTTSYQRKAVARGTKLYYRIQAVNAAGASDWAGPTSVTTP